MLDLLKRTRRAPGATLGAAVIGLLSIASVVLPWVLRDPNLSDFTLARPGDGGPPLPSFAHPLGTDQLHRDVLSRLAAGGRISLFVGVVASTLATIVGSLVGVASATAKRAGAKRLDAVLMRVVDVLLALPFLLLVTAIGVFAGRTTVSHVVWTLGLTSAVAVARIVRARADLVLTRDFVEASRLLGSSYIRIAVVHVIPNVAGTAIALGTSLSGAMILAEAVLSYLSVGIEPPFASWGRMLHESESLLGTRPLLVVAPACVTFLASSGFFRLGEALRVGLAGRDERGSALGRWPIDLLLGALSALLVVALPRPTISAPLPAEASAPTRGGELHLATYANVATLDSALAYDEVGTAIGRHVFGRLLGWDEHGRIVPDLALDYRFSDDQKTLTMLLRRGLVFHDGAPLLAADVKRSIERALGPKSACP